MEYPVVPAAASNTYKATLRKKDRLVANGLLKWDERLYWTRKGAGLSEQDHPVRQPS